MSLYTSTFMLGDSIAVQMLLALNKASRHEVLGWLNVSVQ